MPVQPSGGNPKAYGNRCSEKSETRRRLRHSNARDRVWVAEGRRGDAENRHSGTYCFTDVSGSVQLRGMDSDGSRWPVPATRMQLPVPREAELCLG